MTQISVSIGTNALKLAAFVLLLYLVRLLGGLLDGHWGLNGDYLRGWWSAMALVLLWPRLALPRRAA